MNGPEPLNLRVVVLGGDDELPSISQELVPALTGIAEVAFASSAPPSSDGETTALVVLVAGPTTSPLDNTIARLDADPRLADAEVLVLTEQDRHDDLAGSLDRDRISAIFSLPWTDGALASQARSHIARWLRARAPDDPRLPALDAGGRPLELPDSEMLRDLEMDDAAVARRLVVALERALGERPRIVVPAGTRLTREGHSVDAVLVLLRGSVALERPTRAGPLRLHHASTGPVIGLLSLAQQRRAFFTAVATTEAELVHLSIEQLDLAMRTEPEVVAALAAIAIKGLARRLRRAEQLQVERIELNRDLVHEREQLTRTLQELEDTRDELVRQARLASLGELAAGVAHELNNPVAALMRAASYVADDAGRLLAGSTGELAELVVGAQSRPPLTTAQERTFARQITEAIDDPELAKLLVSAGITDVERARTVVAQIDDNDQLGAAVGLGSALRNLEVAASRIAELASSLRTFARPGADQIDGVDLREVLDDALRLVEHRLDDVAIHREYGPMRPVHGHPAELGQVVTNLLANAADAMAGHGTVIVRTSMDGDEAVLEVIDDGPGIPADGLERLDEPRFTTKQGTVRFGLGLGLSIVRRIIEAHGGRFNIRSRPGRTVAEVRLPTDEVT